MKMFRRLGVASVLAATTFAYSAFADDKPATQPAYPLDTCVVSGEKLGGDMGKPVVLKYEGREVKLCCSGCVADFRKEPAKYLKMIDDAAAAKAATQPSTKPAAS